MSEPRILPAAEPRVETGTVQFGEDWPGLFIRGKHCALYYGCLDWAIQELEKLVGVGDRMGLDVYKLNALRGLREELADTRVKPRGE